MSVDNFIPELWSTRLLRHLDRVLVYAQPSVSNRNWEGEINDAGDTVHIQKVGSPSVFDYVPNQDMPAPEAPEGDTLALVIDQFKGFNVQIDNVDATQVNVRLLDEFASRAGIALAQGTDAFVANLMVGDVPASNEVGSDEVPITVQADGQGDFTPYELAVELRRLLAAQDAPLDSLWVAIDPNLEAEFLKDEQYIDTATRTETRTGQIGQVAGFDVLRTTGVPTTASSEKILAGAGNYATTFANQLTKVTAYEPERRHSDAVKGLEVYGAKVVEPETLALAHVANGEGS